MFLKLLPLYLLIAAGYFAGRKLKTNKESFALLLFYLITPAVIFTGAVNAKLETPYMVLPAFFFLLSGFFCFVSYRLAGSFFASPAKNILGFAGGNANSGYFGIPVGVSLFGEWALAPIVLCSFGFVLCEHTLGFYLTARGHHSPSESIRKVLKLPSVYAFVSGLIANASGFQLTGGLLELSTNVRGAYTVLGIMMIGLALSEMKTPVLDLKFTTFATVVKFILWPVAVLTLLAVDRSTLNIFSPELRQIVFFMSTLPLAANTVAVATFFRAEPDKAAMAVLVTTMLAMVVVPAFNGWFN